MAHKLWCGLFLVTVIGCGPVAAPDVVDVARDTGPPPADVSDVSDATPLDGADVASDVDIDAQNDVTDAAPVDAPITFGAVQALFDRSCAAPASGASCHATGSTMSSLDLSSDVWPQLVNQPSIEVPSMNLVTPGQTDQSYLFRKLDGTFVTITPDCIGADMPCGVQMPKPPFGAGPLPPNQLDIVRRWIEAGAPM